MSSRLPLAAEIAAVRALAGRLGLGFVEPRLLAAAHHTTLHLAPLRLVARVQSAGDRSLARAAREVALVRALAAAGAAVPMPPAFAGPHRADHAVVTLWPLLAGARPAEEADGAWAAAALMVLHRALATMTIALPPYTDMLDRCAEALASAMLTAADRALLGNHLARLRGAIGRSDAARRPIHGDIHLGNLLIGPTGPVWIDWEEACLGPAALDLAGLPPALWPIFTDTDQALIATCADLRSVTVAIWCAADPDRSDAVREAAAYHLARVRRMG